MTSGRGRGVVLSADPRWPVPVSVVSITVAAVGLFAAGVFLTRSFQRVVAGDAASPSVVIPALQMLASVLLLIAGVGVLKRTSAAALHIAYAAAVALGALLAGAFLCIRLLGLPEKLESIHWLAEIADTRAITGYFVLQACLVQLSYGVFVAIWFRRPTVRAQIISWRSGALNDPERARSRWPIVLGSVSLIVASASLGPLPLPPGRYHSVCGLVVADVLLGLLLAVSAVYLLARLRPTILYLTWGAFKLLWCVFLAGALVTASEMGRYAYGRLCAEAVYALFLLIWFNRERIQQEVESWPPATVAVASPKDALREGAATVPHGGC